MENRSENHKNPLSSNEQMLFEKIDSGYPRSEDGQVEW